jgi:hypothetical protein
MRRFEFNPVTFTTDLEIDDSEAQQWVNTWLSANHYTPPTVAEAGQRLCPSKQPSDHAGAVNWTMQPAPNIPYFLHKFSLLDAFEIMARFCEAKASKRRVDQQLHLGETALSVVATLPQYVSRPEGPAYASVGSLFGESEEMVGSILGRPVYRLTKGHPHNFLMVTPTTFAVGTVLDPAISFGVFPDVGVGN